MVVPSNPSRHPRNVIARRQITTTRARLIPPVRGGRERLGRRQHGRGGVGTSLGVGRAWGSAEPGGRPYTGELIRRAAANRGAVGTAPGVVNLGRGTSSCSCRCTGSFARGSPW